MFQIRTFAALAVVMCGSAFAQPGGRRMGMPLGGPGDFSMVRPEFGMAGKVVAGAPYTAQAVTQFTQTLADGNHIQKTTTASMARDSQGRTRSERSVSGIGPLAGSGTATKAVFINDPVAGVGYMLDATSHTARQMPGMANRHRPVSDSGAQVRTESARGAMRQRAMANLKTDDLGTQVIDGLAVQGKRITRTVPA
ncbi:MAG TPA: hypothetical protein VH157_04825, partial [Bryobacteraceae bacterium]|nr:hypothetical protein [Bryobacteraceae bacterium]